MIDILRECQSIVVTIIGMLPLDFRNKTFPCKYVIAKHLQIVNFHIIKRNPNCPIIRKKSPCQFQTVFHENKPRRMVKTIVVVETIRACIVRRIDMVQGGSIATGWVGHPSEIQWTLDG